MITLTTDFGYQDHYVAVMKAVILSINPNAKVVDITHGVRKHDIRHAAYILKSILPYFPNAVHVFVIDPGVGTSRRCIAAKLESGWFVGPDNGILTLVQKKVKETYEIEIEGKSTTFHGRDIFAPAAARIDMGDLGFLRKLKDFIRFPYQEARKYGNKIYGEIIHIDHFGNIITNIPRKVLGTPKYVVLNGRKLRFLPSYGFAEKNELIALINSEEFLEFGVNMGSASSSLNLKPGDKIEIIVD